MLAASAVLLPLPHPGTSGCRLLQLIATTCTCTSRKSIQPSTPLPEISVFIAGQGYSRPVSPTHGIILPTGQHTAIYSFTSAPLTRGRGKGGRQVRGNGRSDTEPSGKIQIRKFCVAGLLLQPFQKGRLLVERLSSNTRFLSEGSQSLWLIHTNMSNFEDTFNRRESCPSGDSN